jgi:N-acetylglucosamine-6-sulfatase
LVRSRLRWARAFACLLAATCCLGPAFTGSTALARGPQTARPNVILITTDDQSLTDLGVMRNVRAQLGRRGTTFTNAFSPYPLCCPARASILTGQYAHNHSVFGNRPPYGGFQAFDDDNTLPLWLQSAGYRTAIIGKYLNGYPGVAGQDYVAPGWDLWHVPTRGIYNYRHWTLNEDGRARQAALRSGFTAQAAGGATPGQRAAAGVAAVRRRRRRPDRRRRARHR